MTAALGPGVGLAEGPVEGDSFGKLRCGLIGEAFRSVSATERDDAEAIEGAIGRAFESRGLDRDRPYLEPGARRDYV